MADRLGLPVSSREGLSVLVVNGDHVYSPSACLATEVLIHEESFSVDYVAIDLAVLTWFSVSNGCAHWGPLFETWTPSRWLSSTAIVLTVGPMGRAVRRWLPVFSLILELYWRSCCGHLRGATWSAACPTS